MAIKTNQSTDGTSSYSHEVRASVQDLINVYGEPTFEDNTGRDKVNFEWEMETEEGSVFTIYDWKEYRKLSRTKKILWHIGAKDVRTSSDAQSEVLKDLVTYVK